MAHLATQMRPRAHAGHGAFGTELAGRLQLIELLALVATIPAFYLSMLAVYRPVAVALYGLASICCAIVAASAGYKATRRHKLLQSKWHAPYLLSGLLVGALALSASLPTGAQADVLGVRMATAFLVLLRMAQSLLPQFWHGRLAYVLTLAVGIMGLCGLGFWWLEPQARTFGDAMWLAFTTAATVGYGDMVPSTSASKIFAVFVVLLGFGALSLVTAAIAAMWVQSDEQRMEDDILRDLHAQVRLLREEIAQLRAQRPAD